MSKEILSNGTSVDLDRLTSDELAYLMSERELANQIDQRQDRIDARNRDIALFFGALTLRHQQLSAECGGEQ